MGCPTVFIRLTGCPLRCVYCDTEYAFQGGEWLSIDYIIREVSQYKTNYITVTGGEPLAQKNCLVLLDALCESGYEVSLETSGALRIQEVNSRVSRVVDVKTPASGEASKNLFDNFTELTANDQLKFVICDRADYDWSKAMIERFELNKRCDIWFSGSFAQIKPVDLAEWILQDQLNVRFQMQLHKLLWADEPGR
ncbi:MAG TPA: 7-carboxy-7-deazaguanine synthase QueE [Gammaproteobacteria bacterium]|nr:7-carboxy-7-deazaguanine synthase QueE [Gammaproteobacteria bacterium]